MDGPLLIGRIAGITTDDLTNISIGVGIQVNRAELAEESDYGMAMRT
jgi:hypothetical protein